MTTASQPTIWTRSRLLGIAIALAVFAVFVVANAHLVFVSFMSQPDCVLTSSKQGAAFRAAKPSC